MNYVRTSYRGGLTQCFKRRNNAEKTHVLYVDINSSYPAIFVEHACPDKLLMFREPIKAGKACLKK